MDSAGEKVAGIEKASNDKLNPEEQALLQETRWLYSLTPEDRTRYVTETIEFLSKALKQIAKEESQTEALGKLLKFVDELDEKQTTLLPPIKYLFRPEFLPVVDDLFDDFAAIWTSKMPQIRKKAEPEE